MASVELPRFPGIRTASPYLIDQGFEQAGALGSPGPRVDRLGNRYGIEVTLPPMWSEPHGRLFSAALRRAKTGGALYAFPQDGFDVGAPGGIVIDGAGQTGKTITVRGATPYYAFRTGQFFSMIHSDGRRYLSALAVPAFADAAGKAELRIEESIRRITADGAVCEFARPMIEGTVVTEARWNLQREPFTNITFTIVER